MSGRAQPHGWQRWLRIAGTLVSSALFIWLLSRQDWVTVWNHLRMLSGWLIVLVVDAVFISCSRVAA